VGGVVGVIVVYVVGAWLSIALLLAWPVGAVLGARHRLSRPAAEGVLEAQAS
jgi:hypothetical protein